VKLGEDLFLPLGFPVGLVSFIPAALTTSWEPGELLRQTVALG
jgi:hypothetical protein